MKALSLLEVNQLLENFQSLRGSKVQNIFYQGSQCLLELWSATLKKQYFFFDVHKVRPFCFYSPDRVAMEQSPFKSPVGLFSKGHLRGKKLTSITLPLSTERILLFNFESFFLEFSMIPHFVNIKVSYNGKSLYWYKAKEGFLENTPLVVAPPRSLLNMKKEWLGGQVQLNINKEKGKKQNTFILFLSQKIKKTKRALLKNDKDIKDREGAANIAQNIAFRLRATSSLAGLNKTQITHIKEKKSWAWNMDDQFARYKKLIYKLEQTQSRQKDLKKEIDILNALVENSFLKSLNIVINLVLFKKCKVEKIPQLLLSGEKSYEVAFKKGFFKKLIQSNSKKSFSKNDSLFPGIAKRSLLLDSGVMVVGGKNAKANIDLLRQAKPWHTWVHLRDYPSSHAIVLIPKSEKTTDKEIIKIGRWLAEISLKKESLANIKLDIIYTQCRFVKSIKGDSLGRVSYKNEKTILL